MRLLVTGATGFVGKNLIPKIIKIEKISHIALLNYDNDNAIEIYSQFKGLNHINLLNNNYKKEIKDFNPEIVLHLASYLTSKDDEESINKLLIANIEFGTNLLDALNSTNIKYFINVGTFAEYFYNDGELKSAYLYSATKTAFRSIIDYYHRKIGFKWINIIPYTIYGGIDTQKKVIDYIVDSLDVNNPIAMSGGEQILDFIYIDDVVDFFINLFVNLEKLETDSIEFHLGTGKGTSIKELAKLIEKITNKMANINWGALPYREMDVMQAIAHTTKNKTILNWKSKYDLEKGIREYLGVGKDV